MFKKLFGQKATTNTMTPPPPAPSVASPAVPAHRQISIEEQKILHRQRKQAIIDEFGKSVINFLYDEIWTPLHIIDFMEVEIKETANLKATVESAIKTSVESHKSNLRGRIYRQSLNLQPGNLLILVKNNFGDILASFKDRSRDLEALANFLEPRSHRLLLLRHFIPPVPDDLHKFDDVMIPQKFQEALTEIVNYCDLNYSLDNVNFDKWEKLISDLSDSGVVLHFPNQEQEVPLLELLTEDYSSIGYHKITVKQILKDTVEKHTVVIPLFVIFLAFFCSESADKSIFPYHFLFTATGESKERTMTRGLFSFPKLFNVLLDEGLLFQQFAKCLSILYNEAFFMRQAEMDDLFLHFRDRYSPTLLRQA